MSRERCIDLGFGIEDRRARDMNIYVNTNNLGDPFNLFQTDNALVGNPSMTPARTESYEYALNIQINRNIAFNLGAWVKNMDQLTSMQKYRSGTQDYWVMKLKNISRSLKNAVAIIGPCLDQENFEVDETFKEKFIRKNLYYKTFFGKKAGNNKIYFDMRGLIDLQLRELSINDIFHVNKDTYSEENLFFSHRRAKHRDALPTGRMINIIGFKQ